MKAKQTPVQQAVAPRSLKDAGYQTAQIGEGRKAIAQFVLEQCPDFLDACPAEVKAELFAGFQLRAHELWGAQAFRLGEGSTLIPVEGKEAHSVSIDVNVAMAYTAQSYGKLKEENPALHSIIKQWRERFSKYASNCMADLRSACKRIVSGDTARERAQNKVFADALKDAFAALDKRVKVAQSRTLSDSTADPVKFRMAVDAFWKVYNT